MIELRLIGGPDEINAALTALRESGIRVHADRRRKAKRTDPGSEILYGAIDPPRPTADRAHGLGDLARALGGEEDSFTGKLLQLLAKAQATPANYVTLCDAFPKVAIARELWMAADPPPDPDQLQALVNIAESVAQARLVGRAARDAGLTSTQRTTG